MRIKAILLVLAAAGLLSGPADAAELISTDKALRKIFRDASSFERREIFLSTAQQSALAASAQITFGPAHQPVFDLYTAKAGGDIVGYGLVDTVIGKWGPIRYMVGLSPQGAVREVIVLEYLEIRGKPIAKNRFLKQYKNKDRSHPIELQKDIDGISGATISSRSITDGIRTMVHALELIN